MPYAVMCNDSDAYKYQRTVQSVLHGIICCCRVFDQTQPQCSLSFWKSDWWCCTTVICMQIDIAWFKRHQVMVRITDHATLHAPVFNCALTETLRSLASKAATGELISYSIVYLFFNCTNFLLSVWRATTRMYATSLLKYAYRTHIMLYCAITYHRCPVGVPAYLHVGLLCSGAV